MIAIQGKLDQGKQIFGDKKKNETRMMLLLEHGKFTFSILNFGVGVRVMNPLSYSQGD